MEPINSLIKKQKSTAEGAENAEIYLKNLSVLRVLREAPLRGCGEFFAIQELCKGLGARKYETNF